MATSSGRSPRRTTALSRGRIVDAAIEILDSGGEEALTLRALTVGLSTGYGALYHHVDDRDDLLSAAADTVLARPGCERGAGEEPEQALRELCRDLYDAIDAHPWVGAQLTRQPWRPALLDVYESISRELQALDVPRPARSDAAGVLVNYVLGVAGQNAANARALASSGQDRATFLADVAARWAQLDPQRYPSLSTAATGLREHDDREQFLAGVDLIIAGIEARRRTGDDAAP